MQETGPLRNSREKFFFLLMMMCCLMLTGFLPMPWRRRNFQQLSFLAVGFCRVGTISHRDGFKGERLALLDGVLVWYDHGTEIRPYACDEEPPFGASFAVRRSLLEAMPGFRTDLGCKGALRGRGEETEFLQRCIAAGALGVYVGRALCWHKVDERRLTLPALYRYGIESGRAHKAIARSAGSGSVARVPLHIARGLVQLLKGRGDRFRQCVINAGIEVGMRGTRLPANEAR